VLPESGTPAGAAGLVAVLADPARALVGVDLDGTIAPIVSRPAAATPAAGAVGALRALAARVGTCAVLTGRPAADAVALLGLTDADRLTVLGHYGQQRWRAGALVSPPPPAGIDEVRARLEHLLLDAPDGVRLEDKGLSLAVHTRQAADPAAALAALVEPVGRLATGHRLVVQPGRYVLELRPPGGDKGEALRELAHDRDARSVVYVGDDRGDLPAFEVVAALRAEGVPGVRVLSDDGSGEVPDELRQRADIVLSGPADVVDFLAGLAAAIGEAG
jgi:trehalose 6-phosphate phosphatase